MMYIDYLFLVKCLSDLCINGDRVLNDFNPKGETDSGVKGAKNALFLVHGLLELGIGVGYVNTKKSVRFGLHSFVPLVVERDEKPKMMAAVNMLRSKYKELMNDDDLWREMKHYLLDGVTYIAPRSFGRSAAYAYFDKLDKPVVYLNAFDD